jgi:hypothetical protein
VILFPEQLKKKKDELLNSSSFARNGPTNGPLVDHTLSIVDTVDYHDLSHLFQLVPPLLPMRLALRFVPLLLIFYAQLFVE